jgi:hypothetical protein
MAQAETTAAEGVRRPVGRPRSQGERYSEALVIKMTPRQLATILALVERDGASLAPSTYARWLLLHRAVHSAAQAWIILVGFFAVLLSLTIVLV